MKSKLSQSKKQGRQLIALGANVSILDEALEHTLAKALIALAKAGFAIRAVSRFYSTPCFPVGAGPNYVNAAVVLESAWSAEQILQRLHEIEGAFGRERVQRWGQRTLDLDLIGVDDVVLPDLSHFRKWHALAPALQAKTAPERLILPHPRMQDRAFVLVPLADIAGDWVHPVLAQSVDALLAQIPKAQRAEVTPI